MTKSFFKIIALFFSFLHASTVFALTYSTAVTSVSDFFSSVSEDENAGSTTFLSLNIPFGGRAESLGSAYTGLSDDISFFDYNAAASSMLDETEIAVFHNAWISDSALETLAATTRFGDFGMGAAIKCFYVPFTEYDYFGNKQTGGYYSETTGITLTPNSSSTGEESECYDLQGRKVSNGRMQKGVYVVNGKKVIKK